MTNHIIYQEPPSTKMLLRPFKSKAIPTLIFKRYRSAKPSYNDLESYLRYAEFVKLRKESTTFLGTTFEMKVKEKLQSALNIPELQYSGGAYDNGIDLIGKLDISQFKTEQAPEKPTYVVNGKRIKPLALRKNMEIDILVQCKSFASKISAKEIRELSGIFHYNIAPKDRNKTLVIMTAPNLLTPQGQAQIDKVDTPMVYCQISRMKQVGENEYDSSNYAGGQILKVYFNPYSIALFQGTNFQLHAVTMIDE